MLGMVTQVFVTFNEELPKYMEYCFYLLHDTKAYFEFDRWRGTEWEKKQGQRPRERGRQERIKWAAATMGAGMCSIPRGTALICIRPILHG